MWFARLLCLVGVVVVLGCSSGGPASSDDPSSEAEIAKQDIKAMLEDIAETGEVEEAVPELRETVEESLREVDAATADTLIKQLDELGALTSPDQIKAKAKEIASTL